MNMTAIGAWAALLGCLVFFSACSNNPPGPGGTVDFAGTVSLTGAPFSGVDVYLSWGTSQKITTGGDGKFRFSNVMSGSYIVTPAKPGYVFSPSNFLVGQSTREDLNSTAAAATYGTALNSIAEDFTALNQNGTPVTLSSLHGKVVLIDFTADWCDPCREKALTAEAFYQTYKSRGFEYILIVIEGDPAVWAAAYGLTFPVLDDNSKAIYDKYKMTPLNIPLPHVLDRNMTIRYKKEGWNKAEVEGMIQKLL